MTNYPKANRTRAWFQDNFPGATINPNAGVLHTTEGTSLPSYSGGATAPTYTAVPNFKAKRLDWFAHFPDERSARALRNEGGGVETNTLNVIQVELVGTCAPGIRDDWKRRGLRQDAGFIFWPQAPKWALDDLAEFIAWAHKAHGIKITGPKGPWTPYPESFGAGGQRFSMTAWRNFYGWCGHQHVPENVHGDPGAFPWGYVEAKAQALAGGKPAEPTKPTRKPSPNWDAVYRDARKAEKALGKSKAPARRKDLNIVQRIARRWSTRY